MRHQRLLGSVWGGMERESAVRSQGHTCLRWTYTDLHSCNLQNTAVCINFINIGEQG
jgi:hypothetical protein